MSKGKREPGRAVTPTRMAQGVSLQGLYTKVSDFQNKLLSPLGTPCDAFSASSRAKTEPVVKKNGFDGAAPQVGAWAQSALTSDDLLHMTQRAVELTVTIRLLMLEKNITEV